LKIARIIGQVVSTIKDPRHEGFKLLLAQPVDAAGVPSEPTLLVIDAAQAGVGDYVLVVCEGKSARQVIGVDDTPCEAIAVGVIDHLEIQGRKQQLAPPGIKESKA
jgi:microcompartment protein CcmK/EutM